MCRSLFPLHLRYNVIYCDPPWEYDSSGNLKEKPYPTMTQAQLKGLPVAAIADTDCALFMWTTSPLLKQAIEVMEAWGFRFVTVYKQWLKRTASGTPATTPGYWSMGSTEMVLLGTKGRLQKFKRVFDDKQEIEAVRGTHSEKPAAVRDDIWRLLDVQRRIELFARHRVDGWDAWGLDVPGYFYSDSLHSAAPVVTEYVRVFLFVGGDGVSLLHDIRQRRSCGTQTDVLTMRTPRFGGAEPKPKRTATLHRPPSLYADRVPVCKHGVLVRGAARPSRQTFAKWWRGKERNAVYSVDPEYLEKNPDIRDIVRAH